jgi:hypothetical protein
MPLIKTKALKMTDADVTYISLVDHGASRVPFKIIKQEKQDMGKHFAGLDIGRLFSRKAELPPVLVGVVVKKSDDFDDVTEHVKKSGFVIDAPEEVEGATIFQQEELSDDDTRTPVTIRLNEDIAVVMKGFNPYNMETEDGSFADRCEAQGFYPGVRSVTEILSTAVMEAVSKAENPVEASKTVVKLMDEAKQYFNSMIGALPAKAFKLESPIEKKAKAKPKKKIPPKVKDMEDEDEGEEMSDEAKDKKPKKMMKVSISEDDVQNIVHSQIEAFINTIATKVDEVATVVKGMDGRMKKSEATLVDVQKAIDGTVVHGSEDDDAGAPVKKGSKEYVPQDFDTGFDRHARQRMKVA